MRARWPRPGALALAAGAALWALAAFALWDRTAALPRQPDLDASRFFGDSFLQRSATYERFLAIDGLLATTALLVAFALFARHGHRLMRESAAGRVGTGMLLGMLGFAVAWLSQLPFGLARSGGSGATRSPARATSNGRSKASSPSAASSSSSARRSRSR